MQVFLETGRLILRRFTDDDVDLLVELDADPEVMRYINGGEPTSRAEVADEVLPAFLGYYERYPGYGFWAAIEKSTGDFLGWFHFRPKEGGFADEPELGYRLLRSAWGQNSAPRRVGRTRSPLRACHRPSPADPALARLHHDRGVPRGPRSPRYGWICTGEVESHDCHNHALCRFRDGRVCRFPGARQAAWICERI